MSTYKCQTGYWSAGLARKGLVRGGIGPRNSWPAKKRALRDGACTVPGLKWDGPWQPREGPDESLDASVAFVTWKQNERESGTRWSSDEAVGRDDDDGRGKRWSSDDGCGKRWSSNDGRGKRWSSDDAYVRSMSDRRQCFWWPHRVPSAAEELLFLFVPPKGIKFLSLMNSRLYLLITISACVLRKW